MGLGEDGVLSVLYAVQVCTSGTSRDGYAGVVEVGVSAKGAAPEVLFREHGPGSCYGEFGIDPDGDGE